MKIQFRRLIPGALAGALVLAVCLSFKRVHAENAPPAAESAASTSIADVAWIAGHWGLEQPAGTLEEIWSAPRGDCMMGMFRWMKNDKLWIYELLTIREEAGTLVFRFRHFGKALEAWEAKDQPLTYRLKSLTSDEAVFENSESEKAARYIFRRSGDDALLIRLESEKDGRVGADEFSYRRQ
jgi:hypothetical protein